uniref:Ferric reductase NAD binding domain-containing protein n=2 Tax=Ditylum brightwellii TaxID=49249 RepID=A0A7S4SHG0_9STRA|mmetsp:Transcript_29916/g.45126  ORF Transcript_29916/g.45126 Transcript_29916/m.45126 type:complete len:159 (-) Transcript_29916:631-1107(-)
MISVLRNLVENPGKIRRAFFYWTVRDQNALKWFPSILDDIYDADTSHIFQIRHFLTSAKYDDRDIGQILLKYAVRAQHKHNDMDLVLGRQAHHMIETGRPDWDEELTSVKEEAKELGFKKCGIFLCGPLKMAEAVDEASLKLSQQDSDFHFYFSKETF